MFCSKCGKEIKDGEKFCPNCGETIENRVAESSITEPSSETETTQNTSSQKSTPVGFILGLISIIAWILPLAGYPVTICGIVFSCKQLKSADKTSRYLAIAGLILSIIFLIFTLLNSIAGVILNLAILS